MFRGYVPPLQVSKAYKIVGSDGTNNGPALRVCSLANQALSFLQLLLRSCFD